MGTRRTFLIVEDEPDISEVFKLFCEISTDALCEAGLEVEAEFLQAYNYQDATSILNSRPVDFLSLDLVLQKQDKALSNVDRSTGRNPGGMKILMDLSALQNRPLVVVVSGETLISYALDALQKYKALAYYQKSQNNSEHQYMHAVKAALWYLEANDLLLKLEDYSAAPNDIDRVSEYWKKAREELNLAAANERGFPSLLDSRINAVRSKLDPTVKIPGDEWTEHVLQDRVLQRDDWIMLQVEIRNYASFGAKLASQVGPLFFNTSSLIESACLQSGCHDVFVGIRRNDRASGPCLIAVLQKASIDQAKKITAWIEMEFQKSARKFTSTFTEEELPSLTINLWDGSRKPFSNWQELVSKINQSIS